jgi:hypothetical protein
LIDWLFDCIQRCGWSWRIRDSVANQVKTYKLVQLMCDIYFLIRIFFFSHFMRSLLPTKTHCMRVWSYEILDRLSFSTNWDRISPIAAEQNLRNWWQSLKMPIFSLQFLHGNSKWFSLCSTFRVDLSKTDWPSIWLYSEAIFRCSYDILIAYKRSLVNRWNTKNVLG